MFQRAVLGGQSRVQTEGQGHGPVYAFIRVCGWSIVGILGKSWNGQLKPKESGFREPHRNLICGAHKGKNLAEGETVDVKSC